MQYRSAMPKEFVEARERQKRTFVNVTCDACGAVVLNVKARTMAGQPQTQILLARQALGAHMVRTGCSGQRATPDAQALEAAAAPELDELAADLGVSREEAATLAADAMAGMRGVPVLDIERTASTDGLAPGIRADPAFHAIVGGQPVQVIDVGAMARDPGTFLVPQEDGS